MPGAPRLCAEPLTGLKSVGPAVAAKLHAAGIRDVGDLLMLRPRRYQDRRQITPIHALTPGAFALAHGRIVRANVVFGGGRRGRRYRMTLDDGTGALDCMFFRVNATFAAQTWRAGVEVTVAGRVDRYQGRLQIAHPEVLVGPPAVEAALRPIYPQIAGVGERTLRRLVAAAVSRYADAVAEPLPEPLRARHGFPAVGDALRRVHRPPADVDPQDFLRFRDPALRRFIFSELLTLQLALALRRRQTAEEPARPIALPADLGAWLAGVLPFRPTDAQRRVLAEIAGDLRRGHPTHRLLEGDVGSGKTAVAYAAARLVHRAGGQTAIMAPTEILAQQHHRTLGPLFAAAGLRCELLTAGLPRAAARAIIEATAAGEVDCLVGTHSVIGESVSMPRLALAVVDEQHRFGVRQRLALRQKAELPHLLVMTATPIPRTLALTAYGDLDVSVLDELPPGRRPVTTTLHRRARRAEVFTRVCRELDAGRQAFVVYPLVEESDAVDVADATTEHAVLARGPFARHRVGLVHGRMSAEEKDARLRAFGAGDLDVLVCTTVVEVGIDVPNATVMVIEHADRFGLSQLHQLRGRVGRGAEAGYCLLIAGARPTADGLERLRVLTGTTDGFEIAQADLEMRGPGEVLGTRQAGLTDLEIADLVRDAALVEPARAAAEELLAADPTLSRPAHAAIRREVWSRWAARLELVAAG